MVKVLSFSFEQCFGRVPCYLSKGSLKPDFLDIYLTPIFEVRKFKKKYVSYEGHFFSENVQNSI